MPRALFVKGNNLDKRNRNSDAAFQDRSGDGRKGNPLAKYCADPVGPGKPARAGFLCSSGAGNHPANAYTAANLHPGCLRRGGNGNASSDYGNSSPARHSDE